MLQETIFMHCLFAYRQRANIL